MTILLSISVPLLLGSLKCVCDMEYFVHCICDVKNVNIKCEYQMLHLTQFGFSDVDVTSIKMFLEGNKIIVITQNIKVVNGKLLAGRSYN